MPRKDKARERRRCPWERALTRVRAACTKATLSENFTVIDVQSLADDVGLIGFEARQRGRRGHLWRDIGQEHLSGLIALLGLALRRSCATLSPESTADSRAAYGALRKKLCLQFLDFVVDSEINVAAVRTLAWGVLRTHILRCYSALLSDAGASLLRQRSQQSVTAALGLLPEVNSVLTTLIVSGRQDAESSDDDLAVALASELQASGLMEHFSHLVLRLCACGGDEEQIGTSLGAMGDLLSHWCPFRSELLANSPCLSYLLCAHLARLCTALDGGLAYGMPAASSTAAAPVAVSGPSGADETPSLAAPPLFNTKSGTPVEAARRDVGTHLAQWALSLWADAIAQLRRVLREDPRPSAGGSSREEPGPAGGQSAAEAGGRAGASGADTQSYTASTPPGVQQGRDLTGGAATGGPSRRTAAWQSWQEAWRVPVEGAAASSSGSAASSSGASAPAGPPEPPAPLRSTAVGGATAARRLHVRGAFEVSTRLASAAVAAMAQSPSHGRVQQRQGPRAAPGGAGCGGRSAPALRDIPVQQRRPLAVAALLCAYAALQGVMGAPAVSQRAEERMRRYWDLLLAATALSITHERRVSGAKNFGPPPEELSVLLSCVHVPAGAQERLPPSPSPNIAAALSAGYLKVVGALLGCCALGQQLRRSPRPAPHIAAWCHTEAAAAWAQVLAFGPRACVLSLLEAAVKAVRHDDWDVDEHWDSIDGRIPVALVSVQPHTWLLQLARAQADTAPADAASAVPATAAAMTPATTSDGAGTSAVAGAATATATNATSPGDTVNATDSSIGAGTGATATAAPATAAASFAQLRLALSCIAYNLVPFLIFTATFDFKAFRVKVQTRPGAIEMTIGLLHWLPVLLALHNFGYWRLVIDNCGNLLGQAVLQATAAEGDAALQRRLTLGIHGALQAVLHLAPAHLRGVVGSAAEIVAAGRTPAADAPAQAGGGGGAAAEAEPRPLLARLQRMLGGGGVYPDVDLLAAVEAASRGKDCGIASGGDNGGASEDGSRHADACRRTPVPAPGASGESLPPALPVQLQPCVEAAALLLREDELPEEMRPEYPTMQEAFEGLVRCGIRQGKHAGAGCSPARCRRPALHVG